jgi:hypothetical protein
LRKFLIRANSNLSKFHIRAIFEFEKISNSSKFSNSTKFEFGKISNLNFLFIFQRKLMEKKTRKTSKRWDQCFLPKQFNHMGQARDGHKAQGSRLGSSSTRLGSGSKVGQAKPKPSDQGSRLDEPAR